MSGTGTHVVPFSLYNRLHPQESLSAIAQRFLETVRRMDPALAQASVEGLNALSRLWTYASMILIPLGYQVTDLPDLVQNPEAWHARFMQAVQADPAAAPAVAFFRHFMDWPPDQRIRRADALLIKLMPFLIDPSMAAMFGAGSGGIGWQAAVTNKLTVVLDFSKEHDLANRRFKLVWAFLEVAGFLKSRGLAGRKRPIGFVIDEVTQLLGYGEAEQSLLAADLEELASVYARNTAYGCW